MLEECKFLADGYIPKFRVSAKYTEPYKVKGWIFHKLKFRCVQHNFDLQIKRLIKNHDSWEFEFYPVHNTFESANFYRLQIIFPKEVVESDLDFGTVKLGDEVNLKYTLNFGGF